MRKISIFTVLLTITFIQITHARWATSNEIAEKFEFVNLHLTVNADGSSEIVTEIKYKILKEQARNIASHYTLYYNGNNEEIKILSAKTVNQGTEIVVDEKLMEDKPIASAPQGFDQQRQLMISFPNVTIGSDIYLKYVVKTKQPIMENFFGTRIGSGASGEIQASQLTIESHLPLHFEVNDPTHALKIIESKKGTMQVLTVTLTKPIINDIANEKIDIISDKKFPWISVSTLKHWKDFAKKLSPKYNSTVINQKLPQTFVEIKNIALQKKREIDQINTVTSLLNEKIQYMGDWRSINGCYFPRDLEQIAQSQQGDCKDFSVSTGAILQNMGYKANVVIVNRGVYQGSFTGTIPFGPFNHAMLKVTGPSGTVYWIDPTNLVSMADGIFPDIASKKILVLADSDSDYTQTPALDPKHSQITLNEEWTIEKRDMTIKGDLFLQGEYASNIAGLELVSAQSSIKDSIFYTLSGKFLDESEKKKMVLPDLKSRIVSDLSCQYEYIQRNQLIRTNLGEAIVMPSNDILNNLIQTASDQISDLLIHNGGEFSSNRCILLKNIKIQDVEKLNAKIDTPWISIERVCIHTAQGTQITIKIIVKNNRIINEELKTLEYKKLKSFIEQEFNNVTLIIT